MRQWLCFAAAGAMGLLVFPPAYSDLGSTQENVNLYLGYSANFWLRDGSTIPNYLSILGRIDECTAAPTYVYYRILGSELKKKIKKTEPIISDCLVGHLHNISRVSPTRSFTQVLPAPVLSPSKTHSIRIAVFYDFPTMNS
ncbi:hypothetical protein B0H19DRAFT_1084179 [Mycena capillaripes]|nr:hypothetical protein B0H19DRAFT_1084179 [Mycena capillaripes]